MCQERCTNAGNRLKKLKHMDNSAYKIVCFGDSTTDATFFSETLPEAYKQLKSYSQWLQESLPVTIGKKVEVINAGITGDTTADAKRRFESDVLNHKPNLVIIQFGANDQCIRQDLDLKNPILSLEDFAYNLLFFINRIKKIKAIPVLMTPGMILWTDAFKTKFFKPPYLLNEKYGLNGNMNRYVDMVRRIATNEAVSLIDIYEKEMAYDAKEGHSLFDMLPDGLHPNNDGHLFIANIILEYLKNLKL